MRPLPPLYLALVSALLVGACEAPEPPPLPRAIAAVQAATGPGAVLELLGVAVRAAPQGLLIIAIDMDGPAAESGVRAGDLILAINDAAVSSTDELNRVVAAAAPTGTLMLALLRRGERHQVTVNTGDAAKAAQAAWTPLGLQLREAPPAALKALGVPYGLMVTKVRPPADRTRILPGDLIVGVNQARFASLEEFNKLIAEQHGGTFGLLVRRADADLYIALEAVPGSDNASRGGSAPPRPEESLKPRRPLTNMPLRT
jgi:S1-C subfamily serine protease